MSNEQQAKRQRQAAPLRTQLAEFLRQDFRHNAEEGTTVEDILQDSYWALMAPQFKPYDRIEVVVDTGEWIAELVVLQCERTWAKVALLKKFDLAPVTEMPERSGSDFTIAYKGAQKKWTVIRKSDQQAVRDGFGSRDDADGWMANYQKAIAPVAA